MSRTKPPTTDARAKTGERVLIKTGKGSGEAPVKSNSKNTAKPAPGREGDVGHALRSVYQRTVDETVPPAMLELLGKLG